MRTNGPRNFPNFPKRSLINGNSARIVRISEDDQACSLINQLLNFLRLDSKSVLGIPFKALDVRPQVLRQSKYRLIRGPLNQDLISRIDQCRHCQVIGETSAGRGNYALRIDSVPLRQFVNQWLIAVAVKSGDLQFVHTKLEIVQA